MKKAPVVIRKKRITRPPMTEEMLKKITAAVRETGSRREAAAICGVSPLHRCSCALGRDYACSN